MNARVVVLYLSPKDYASYAAARLDFGAKKSGSGLVELERALVKLITSLRPASTLQQVFEEALDANSNYPRGIWIG